MKYLLALTTLFVALNAAAEGLTFKIENPQDAQALYQIMSGVQEEGAAGKSYRKGRSIICWHVNADMNDDQGKLIPQDDARRYACSMHFNNKGLALPGN